MNNIKVNKIIPMNIIFPLKGDEVLLGIKTRKIAAGLRNGYGGKQEQGETMIQSCVNELYKESGLKAKPADFKKIAEAYFYIHKNNGTMTLNYCDVFSIEKWSGNPKSSEEVIDPQWFNIKELPLDRMMPDAKYWVPKILTGEQLRVTVHYDEDRKNILEEIQIEEIN